MTNSTDIPDTDSNDVDSGYYAVDARRVIQVFEMFQMRPSHFAASGKSSAQGVYYDAKKIVEGKTDNKWGHHTSRAIKSFCHFTQSENGTLLPWRELIEHRDVYDGKEGAGRRTSNLLMTETRLILNHDALTAARQKAELSLEQLAEKTGYPVRLIKAMEKGDWETVVESTARSIANVLGVAEATLFSQIPTPSVLDARDTATTSAETTSPSTATPGKQKNKKATLRNASWFIVVVILGMWASYQFSFTHQNQPASLDWVTLQQTNTPDQIDAVSGIEFTRHEITNQDYLQFVIQNADYNRMNMLPGMHDGDYLKHWLDYDRYPQDLANHPVTYVTWYSAQAFCQWMDGRLPQLHEWQAATTAIQHELSADMIAMLNLCDSRCAVRADISADQSPKDVTVDDGYAETAPVTIGLVSQQGLTHLYGNVAEWLNETSGENGDTIGGSFLGTLTEAVSDKPVSAPKRLASRDLGFRCARTVRP